MINKYIDRFRDGSSCNLGANLALNPEKSWISNEIENTRLKGGKIILEIGPGKSGGVGLNKNDLYIGIEPNFGGELNFKVNKAELGAKIAILDDSLNLPDFPPDLVICLAPNPNDIDNGMLWEYERFINRKKTAVVIVLDTRTWEAKSGLGVKGLTRKVVDDLDEMGRRRINYKEADDSDITEILEHMGIERNCDLHSSADLGSKSVVVWSEPR